jgi:hypothetical protein
MPDREKVIKGLEVFNKNRICLPHLIPWDEITDAIAMLKEQEDRHRLEVHNIGNVDIPEGVSEEHFHLVMNNVVEALQHTDKGESYPYEDTGR